MLKDSLYKFLFPPVWVRTFLLPVAAVWLVYVFYTGQTECATAYGAYLLSAYTLTVWCAAIPSFVRKIKAARIELAVPAESASDTFGHRLLRRQLNDREFRSSSAIYRGMIINYLYTAFRVVTGVYFSSVWFISMAVYYFALGVLRTSLIFSYRKAKRLNGAARSQWESRCYRRTAWLLFLLNIPMGGMILQMIRDSSTAAHYPGTVIYLSAAYTFYSMISSVVGLLRAHREEGRILACARVLNFVAAMMSILGLQSALIVEFGAEQPDFLQMMNTLTGTAVYGVVILLAIVMLHRSKEK